MRYLNILLIIYRHDVFFEGCFKNKEEFYCMAASINKCDAYKNINEPAGFYPIKTRLNSLANLEPYVGKVVKYTKNNGLTWNYVFLEKSLYEAKGQKIVPAAIVGFTASDRWWVGRTIAAKITIDEEMFDPCLNGGTQIHFETAKYDEFKELEFARHGKLDPSYASESTIPVRPDKIKVMAPFTLVRSEKDDVDLKVTLAFSKAFELTQPTFPMPKEEQGQDVKRYSWDVHVNKDRTLDVQGSEALQKVNLIWWEANRLNRAQQFNTQDSVCIDKNEIGAFLQDVLQRKGLSEKERHAFVQYWQSIFEKNEKLPYVQVRLVDGVEHNTLLPPMTVDSSQASFDVKRFYFQFLPVETKGTGQPQKNSFYRRWKANNWERMSFLT